MSIRIKSNSKNKRTFVTIDKMPGANSKAIRAALFEIGSESVKHLRMLIKSKNKTGRMYGNHQASAPGEAPASKTHKLEQTLDYKVRGDYQCEFGDQMPYGYWLEHGTEDTRIAPRPHISRTVKEKRRDIKGIFDREFNPKRMLK